MRQLAQHQQRAWGICSGPALCQQLGDEPDSQQCAVWTPNLLRPTQQMLLWVTRLNMEESLERRLTARHNVQEGSEEAYA